MESRIGHDFSRVRVHTDSRAAESARAVGALAYTVGRDVVFGAGQYAPETRAGGHLLAHELAHTIQQQGGSGALQNRLEIAPADSPAEAAADRVADAAMRGGPPPAFAPAPSTATLARKEAEPEGCDKAHAEDINKARDTARSWLSSVNTWVDAHLANIKKRTPKGGDFRKVGSQLFTELSLLDKHFRYSDIVRKDWHSGFPDSPDWEGDFKTFETLGRASYFIRKAFLSVSLGSLGFRCVAPCPKGEDGADWVGSARPGFKEFTIYTNCFDKQSDDDAKPAVVLHEAFHASFPDFSGDSYSNAKDYPGGSPVTNADSYATFASEVATGSSYRIIKVPETTITASPGP